MILDEERAQNPLKHDINPLMFVLELLLLLNRSMSVFLVCELLFTTAVIGAAVAATNAPTELIEFELEMGKGIVFKKYTGIFAISTKGVLGWELYEKSGINADRLYEFLETHITSKYKNKLIILDNASSHRNQLVKDVIKKDNNLLYAVPYQHYTNAIEGYFNVLKSRLQKKKGLTYDELVKNVKDVLDEIPIHIYKNLIRGAYDRSEKYVKRPSTRKRKPKKYLD